MRIISVVYIFQLFHWENAAFLVQPNSRSTNRFFEEKHKRISRHFNTKVTGRENKSIRFNAQENFEIPRLEDSVQCGGRDFIKHIKFLHKSVLNLTGRGLYDRMKVNIHDESSDNDIYKFICRNERYVLISHGTQDDPVYNFGNLACLQAFARSWDNLTSMPSRLCVVSKSQDEALRIELMQNVTNFGFVDGEYRGYRVRGDGKFIKLTECCVWNCYEDNGEYIGQAALFDTELSPIVNSTGI
mmetsp:Transcript_21162/g.31381  ORF Transcript_21162/g.31381 Transcript_21162/m.31381 type:complete len:243 (+) Transcript_21162:68-796(+)